MKAGRIGYVRVTHLSIYTYRVVELAGEYLVRIHWGAAYGGIDATLVLPSLDCETIRIPPLMSKRTIRIPEREGGGVGGASTGLGAGLRPYVCSASQWRNKVAVGPRALHALHALLLRHWRF